MKRKKRVDRSGRPAAIEPADETIVIYVVGVASGRADPRVRAFPLISWHDDESQWSHVMRVARAVRRAIAAGGTHLLVPRDQTDWLADNPLTIEYFAARHAVVDASEESGVLFELRKAHD